MRRCLLGVEVVQDHERPFLCVRGADEDVDLPEAVEDLDRNFVRIEQELVGRFLAATFFWRQREQAILDGLGVGDPSAHELAPIHFFPLESRPAHHVNRLDRPAVKVLGHLVIIERELLEALDHVAAHAVAVAVFDDLMRVRAAE